MLVGFIEEDTVVGLEGGRQYGVWWDCVRAGGGKDYTGIMAYAPPSSEQ